VDDSTVGTGAVAELGTATTITASKAEIKPETIFLEGMVGLLLGAKPKTPHSSAGKEITLIHKIS
jgi:hypothetical protein